MRQKQDSVDKVQMASTLFSIKKHLFDFFFYKILTQCKRRSSVMVTYFALKNSQSHSTGVLWLIIKWSFDWGSESSSPLITTSISYFYSWISVLYSCLCPIREGYDVSMGTPAVCVHLQHIKIQNNNNHRKGHCWHNISQLSWDWAECRFTQSLHIYLSKKKKRWRALIVVERIYYTFIAEKQTKPWSSVWLFAWHPMSFRSS